MKLFSLDRNIIFINIQNIFTNIITQPSVCLLTGGDRTGYVGARSASSTDAQGYDDRVGPSEGVWGDTGPLDRI